MLSKKLFDKQKFGHLTNRVSRFYHKSWKQTYACWKVIEFTEILLGLQYLLLSFNEAKRIIPKTCS